MRWYIPIVMVIIALAAVLWLRARETPFIEPITIGVALLTLLGLGFWYIFLTGLRWKTRFLLCGIAVVLVGGVIFGVRRLTRVEGSIGGSGLPRLVWKWSPGRDAFAGQLLVSSNTPPAAVATAASTNAPSFPQFLGPDRSGVIHGFSLVRDWTSAPPRQLWRHPIGVGWSAFAVSAGRAITQEQRGEDELTVAYDLATGAALWAHTNRVRFHDTIDLPAAPSDSWYVLEVRGAGSIFPVKDDVPYAITNPVYVDVDGNGVFDAPKPPYQAASGG